MKHYHIILMVFALGMTSCKKGFLDTPPVTDITRQEYVKDLNSCSEYLNGIYVDLSERFFTAHGSVYADIVADNIKPVGGSSIFVNQYGWNQIANETNKLGAGGADENMNGYWLFAYRITRACNFLIEKTDSFKTENPSKAAEIKGQALVIRAFVYHFLLNIFAQPYLFTPDASHPGIPYVKSYDYTHPETRQTVQQNYEDLLKDIDEAILLIRVGSNNKFFIGHHAAKAIKARILLYKGDYLQAKNIAREVATAVPIMTGSNYPSKLFTAQETEALFQITPVNNAFYSTSFASIYFRRSVLYYASKNIVDLLRERPNDLRLGWLTTNGTNVQITKFPVNVVPGFSEPSMSYYNTVIRSSELYLIASECYAELGNVDSSRFYLDAIRKRADPTAPATTVSGAALLDAIAKERQKELCFENHRMFDLLRTGNGVNRTDTELTEAAKKIPYPHPKAIAPLPVIDVKYYGFPQNPFY